MAQLTDDCFAGGGQLMRADEALARILAPLVMVTETETVPLERAVDRILAGLYNGMILETGTDITGRPTPTHGSSPVAAMASNRAGSRPTGRRSPLGGSPRRRSR